LLEDTTEVPFPSPHKTSPVEVLNRITKESPVSKNKKTRGVLNAADLDKLYKRSIRPPKPIDRGKSILSTAQQKKLYREADARLLGYLGEDRYIGDLYTPEDRGDIPAVGGGLIGRSRKR
jgi:hypothetical protein